MKDLKAKYPLLYSVENPDDLRALDASKLPELADELRLFLLDSIGRTGGHLSSNLGTVELTVALHFVFNTPFDRLVWDVGHQSYTHKILTGRRDDMPTLRQKDGLAGFPRRIESEYDTFGVGHSSTSISAALGMALAAKRQETNRKAVAIIGDGAMTAGMAFEALNHAGDLDADLLVILNDNDMSISANVGGLSNYLARILSGKFYSNVRESGKKMLKSLPGASELARRAEEHVKGMVIPGTLFEELGFNYIGPIDGHDMETLVTTLSNIKEMKGPQFLHVITKKGKGFEPAENDPCEFHGVSAFDTDTGESLGKKANGGPSFTQVFSDWLCDMAARDERLIGITPAMCEGSGLVDFSQQYPDRYYDVGIAEQHAITLAAGLACEGLKPVVAIYSTFLQRGYDQLIHDVAIQNLPVVFAIDRAGLVGPDGATHAGSFDTSFLRCIPNMTIMAPANERECRQLLSTGFKINGPSTIRYPRGQGAGILPLETLDTLPVGKGEIIRQGKSGVAILNFGTLLDQAEIAAHELDLTVVNMRFIKPLDTQLVLKLAAEHSLLYTLEDNVVMGGAGSAVNEILVNMEGGPRIFNLGLPDVFLEHAKREELLADCKLDAAGITDTITAEMHSFLPDSLPLGANSK